MYLRKVTDKRIGRTYLSIAHNHKDENGVTRVRTIKSLGNLEELQKQYDDPIAHCALPDLPDNKKAKKDESKKSNQASLRDASKALGASQLMPECGL